MPAATFSPASPSYPPPPRFPSFPYGHVRYCPSNVIHQAAAGAEKPPPSRNRNSAKAICHPIPSTVRKSPHTHPTPPWSPSCMVQPPPIITRPPITSIPPFELALSISGGGS